MINESHEGIFWEFFFLTAEYNEWKYSEKWMSLNALVS